MGNIRNIVFPGLAAMNFLRKIICGPEHEKLLPCQAVPVGVSLEI